MPRRWRTITMLVKSIGGVVYDLVPSIVHDAVLIIPTPYPENPTKFVYVQGFWVVVKRVTLEAGSRRWEFDLPAPLTYFVCLQRGRGGRVEALVFESGANAAASRYATHPHVYTTRRLCWEPPDDIGGVLSGGVEAARAYMKAVLSRWNLESLVSRDVYLDVCRWARIEADCDVCGGVHPPAAYDDDWWHVREDLTCSACGRRGTDDVCRECEEPVHRSCRRECVDCGVIMCDECGSENGWDVCGSENGCSSGCGGDICGACLRRRRDGAVLCSRCAASRRHY